MSREILSLKQASQHINIDANELKHVAQRGEIAAFTRGDDWFFDHRDLDEWAQRNLLSVNERELKAHHGAMMDKNRRESRENWGVYRYFSEQVIDLELTAKAKAGMIRDMTDLAAKSGFVYDSDALFKELLAREEAASTAIGMEVALLHPRFHDPYLFEESFIAYGRSLRPIFFGAPDGAGTRHFFLICSTDHERHLQMLARLAMLSHGTDLLERLNEAKSPQEALEAIVFTEKEFLDL